MQQQRDIANAVKNAREMALLPYTKRVSQTRAGRPPRDGEERRRPRGRDRGEARDAPRSTATESIDRSTTQPLDGRRRVEVVEA